MRKSKVIRIFKYLIAFTVFMWILHSYFLPWWKSNKNVVIFPNETIHINLWTEYLIYEEDFCNKKYKDIEILIYVHSAPTHYMYRSLIRNTWANKEIYDKYKMATVFIVGQTKNLEIDSNLQWESNNYHDIVQGDYIDTYYNLTYKAVSSLKWISQYCPQTTYVVRVDDDVFVNIFNLHRYIREIMMEYGPFSKTLFCSVRYNDVIDRKNNSKSYLDVNILKNHEYYPTYCLGYAIIMPLHVVEQLLKVVDIAPYIWLDDVFITGMMAQMVNVTHKNIKDIYAIYYLDEFKSNFKKAIFGHVNGPESLTIRDELWKEAEEIENGIRNT